MAVTTEEGEGGGASATGPSPLSPSDYPPLPPSLTGRKEVFFSGKTEPQKLQTEGYEAQKAGMREKGKVLCQSLGTSASFPYPTHSILTQNPQAGEQRSCSWRNCMVDPSTPQKTSPGSVI